MTCPPTLWYIPAMPSEPIKCRICGIAIAGGAPTRRHCSETCKAESRRRAARKWRQGNKALANQRTADWHNRNRERERIKDNLYAKQYRAAHLDKYRANERDQRLMAHGISLEQFAHMVRVQENRCAICRRERQTTRWHVDHDHRCCPGVYSCGKCIRGLLCGSCNLAVGALGDSVAGLMQALQYLAAHEIWNAPIQKGRSG